MGTIGLSDNTLFAELEDYLAQKMPCENSNHAIDELHGGPGLWYLTAKPCPHCKANRGTRLVCDPYAQYLINGGPIRCGKCKNFLGYGMEAHISITRKGT